MSRVRPSKPIHPQPLSPPPGRSADLHLANDAEHRGSTLLLPKRLLLPAHLRRADVRSPRVSRPAHAAAGRSAGAGRHRLRRCSRGAAPEAPAHAGEPCHRATAGQSHADAGGARPRSRHDARGSGPPRSPRDHLRNERRKLSTTRRPRAKARTWTASHPSDNQNFG